MGGEQEFTKVEVVAFGRPATDALAARIAAAQTAHPLDAVTVVVPSNTAGLSARRLLARRGRGLANVNFVTPFRLAELLGAARLGPRKPLTNPVLAAAARAVLRDAPGMFRPVAGHQATHSAVLALYAELSRARPATLDAIAAASSRGAETVRVVRAIRDRLADFYDEDDLARAALDRARTDPRAVADLGTVVWHLPDRVTPAMADLLRALLAAPTNGAVVALTGDPDADRATRAACQAAGLDVPEAAAPLAPPTAQRIVSASDPDEEVRAVVRELCALAEAGTPLDRIAVFHPAPDPYARTLFEQLDAAGIPHNGPGARRLADTAAGRTLLAALDLPDTGWGRADVLALVSGAPVRDVDGTGGAPVPRWDKLSRLAGVVGGIDDWRRKLGAHVQAQRDVLAGLDPESRRAKAVAGEAEQAERLGRFVETLAADVQSVASATTWEATAAAAAAMLGRLFGTEQRRVGWTDEEAAAAAAVDETLARLGALDAIEPDPAPGAFRLAVAAELDRPAARVGTFGHGVLVAPLAASVGLDLDAVFVVGMAEGTCPALGREDALLPEDDRNRAVEGELRTRAEHLAAQHRAYLAAVASGAAVLVFPRGDLRGRRNRLASRWALATATALKGERVFSSEVATLDPAILTSVASFAAGLSCAPAFASAVDRDLAELHGVHGGHGGDGNVDDHPLVAGAVGRGLRSVRARRGPEFTVWDGNLVDHRAELDSPATAAALSPSRLQKWAECPFSYFLAYVLWLGERDDPEEISEIRADHKGTLVHRILERFVGEAIAAGRPDPGEAWTDADRDRLHVIAGEEFAALEQLGRAGRPLMWQRTRQVILDDLDRFLEEDNRHRARGLRPIALEQAFGFRGAPVVAVTLPSGTTLSFKGLIDRVDEGADGHVTVVDYKTSKADSYKGLDDDPVDGGRTLQLGIYAEAAKALFGATDVDARYWLATTHGKWQKPGYAWTDERRARFLDVADTIVEGITAGTFPALSGEYQSFWGNHSNCKYCDFDRVCPRDREDHQTAKADAPELRLLGRLAVAVADDADVVDEAAE